MKSRKRLQHPSRQSVRPADALRKSGGNDDPSEVEPTEHRYDADQYLGEPMEPLLSGANKYGYFFIILGVLLVLVTWLAFWKGAMPWFFAIAMAAFPVLVILLGIRLVKGNNQLR